MFVNEVFESKMKGKKLVSVYLSHDKETIIFEMDGGPVVFAVEGECCSHSWIEHLETPIDMFGAKVLDMSQNYVDETDPAVLEAHESLTVYQTHFHTDRGDIVLEYRNSSNGYYGGYLVVVNGEQLRGTDVGGK